MNNPLGVSLVQGLQGTDSETSSGDEEIYTTFARSNHNVANVKKFSKKYFKGKVDVSQRLHKSKEASKKPGVSTESLFSAGEWLREVILSLGGSTRVSGQQQKFQRIFVTLVLVCICTNATSLVLSILGEPTPCNVVLPETNDDCCTCACTVNSTWCTPTESVSSSPIPLGYGNFFSGENALRYGREQRSVITMLIYLISLGFAAIELGWGILEGNWYMLLCVFLALVVQTSRSIFLHTHSSDKDKSNVVDTAKDLSLWWMVSDMVSCFACVGMVLILPFLRAGFNTLQFHRFGGLLGAAHSVVRNYNIVFAMVLFDWQISSVFYSEVAVIRADVGMSALLGTMYICDVFCLYLSFRYIRYERRIEAAIAFGTKVVLALGWIAFAFYYVRCFVDFKSRAIYLRSLLVDSTYLGVDSLSAEQFLLGACNMSPSESSSSDLLMIFWYLVVAFVARSIAVFYGSLLWLDFGTGEVSKLFFDVIVMKQDDKVAVVRADDTID